MKTLTKLTIGTPALAAVLLLLATPCSQAQPGRKTADQILRQAQQIQERQQAVERIAHDATQTALDIVNAIQKRNDDARAEQQPQRDADAADRNDNSSSGSDNQ